MPSILVLTGPPGIGKTTVARLVADALPRSVHLEADTFWRFIRSGSVAPWLPEAHEQNEVVVQAVARTAAQFAAGGFDVVVDGIVGPWFLDPFRRCAAGAEVGLHYVVLAADLDVTIGRATSRGAHGLSDEDPIRRMHAEFASAVPHEHLILDAGSRTASDVAEQVLHAWRTGTNLVT